MPVRLTVLVPTVLVLVFLCCCLLLVCGLLRRRRKRQNKTQVVGRAKTAPTSAPNSTTEDMRIASEAALRAARDQLTRFGSQLSSSPASSRPSSTTLARRSSRSKTPVAALAREWLNHNQGSSAGAPPRSRRPPGSESSSGPSQLADQEHSARAHAQNWLEGAMLMATSPMAPRPAADPDDPKKLGTAVIATQDQAANMREDDAKVEESKQVSKQAMKRSVVYLPPRPGYHV